MGVNDLHIAAQNILEDIWMQLNPFMLSEQCVLWDTTRIVDSVIHQMSLVSQLNTPVYPAWHLRQVLQLLVALVHKQCVK